VLRARAAAYVCCLPRLWRRLAAVTLPVMLAAGSLPGAFVSPIVAAQPVDSAISAGWEHTCALTSGGGVKCWGFNAMGQLGNATNTDSRTPVDVSGLPSGVSSIALGGNHSCARLNSLAVKCWGSNFGGELGDGTTTYRNIPVDVPGVTAVSGISAGYAHTCALTNGGGVKCWGWNYYGQLGNGSVVNSATPVNVTGLASGVSAISAGLAHTCALTAAGGIWCWGSSRKGQLGNGTTTDSLVPVPVTGLASGVSAISAGGEHTCALMSAGGVKCWGDNRYGQLGIGTTTDSSVPMSVSGLASGVTAISAPGGTPGINTCALTTLGAVTCWGHGGSGALGNGMHTDSTVPVNVAGLMSGVSAVATGYGHSCGLLTGGGVKCWGFNSSGQLGNGTKASSSVPVAVNLGVRKRVVIMIPGLASDSVGGDDFVPFKGVIPSVLVARGIPTDSIIQFSYRSGSSSYSCEHTFGPVKKHVETLERLVGGLAANTDVYLVGHSQGGLVAMAYAASVRDANLIPLGNGGYARLAGVVTLDSPLGGATHGAHLIARLKCPTANKSDVDVTAADYSQIYRTVRDDAGGRSSPLGGRASIRRALFGGGSDNDRLARDLQVKGGPAVLTVGNTDDKVWFGALFGDPDPTSTQWLTNGVSSERVYSRSITDALPGLWWLNFPGVADFLQHSQVLKSLCVADSVWALIDGQRPPESDCISAPAASLMGSRTQLAGAPSRINGTVTDTEGIAMSGIELAALSTDGLEAFSATSDPEGAYSLAVDPGTYWLALHDPNGSHPTGYAAAGGGFTMEFAAALEIAVGNGSTATANAALPDGTPISGTVTDVGGAPLANINVSARTGDGTLVVGGTTDGDGRYELVLAAGTYRIGSDGGGTYASGFYSTGGYVTTIDAATPLTVGGAPIVGINLVLPGIAQLSGRVTNAAFVPLSDILVRAEPAGGGSQSLIFTGDDGYFSMVAEPGTYRIRVEDLAGGYAAGWVGTAGYVASQGLAKQFVVGLTDTSGIDLVLPPLADLTVKMSHLDDPFVRGKPNGTYTLTVANGGTAATSGQVTLAATLPTGLTATTLSGSNWSCTLSTLTCVRSNSLAVGSSYPPVTLKVTVGLEALDLLTSVATVSGGGEANDLNNVAYDLTVVADGPIVASAPPGVTATAGDAQATVTWSAPDWNGGSPITAYTVTSSPGAKTCTWSSGPLSCTANGLTNGTAYTFTVTATNAVGTGHASAASNSVTPLDQPFSDVPLNHPFVNEIRWMRDTGISTGFNDGTYRPSIAVTRQAMSAFMARLAGATLTDCTVAPFTDVATDHPFCREIKWMRDAGISTGFDDDTYRPSIAVTRQAMSAFMPRLAGAELTPCTEQPFSDVAIDHPFCAEIKWMKESDISTGFNDGTYRPTIAVTRQAMSAFMYRVSLLASP
jgi:alpha-tubulin suppressor-like RCC1 family protein